MNPFGRFIELIRNPSYSRTTTLLVILTIALSIPLTVFVAQKQQETRQQAAECPYVDIGGVWCEGNPALTDSRIDLKCTETEADKSCGGKKTYKCSQRICGAPTASVNPSPAAPPQTGNGCGAPFLGTCNQEGAVQNPTCKTNAGWNGVSVKECVKVGSSLCWYDAIEDPGNVSAGKTSQFCYENKEAALSLTGPGQALPINKLSCATPTCLRGSPTKRSDDSWYCFEANRWTGNAFCEGKSQESIGVNLSPRISCTGTPTCAGGCTAVKSANNEWYCFNSAEPTKVCPAPVCPAAAPVGTQITFNLGLSGLGNTGDSQNFSNASGSTKEDKLKRKSRKLFYQVFDQSINQVKEGEGSVSFDSSSGKFKANVDLGRVLTNGTYVVKARVLGYKTRIVRNVNIGPGETTVTANLPTGDIDGNLEVNTLDYDILRSCWGAGGIDAAKCNSNASFRGMADLDDNGTINEFDYNLFLRDFSAAQKEE